MGHARVKGFMGKKKQKVFFFPCAQYWKKTIDKNVKSS